MDQKPIRTQISVGGRPPSDWLTYGSLEKLLTKIYNASCEAEISKIRSRYKNFQKLGLPLGRSPGRGSKIKFTMQEVCQIIFAFELSEYGMSPSSVVELVKSFTVTTVDKFGKKYISGIEAFESALVNQIADAQGKAAAKNSLILAFTPCFLTDNIIYIADEKGSRMRQYRLFHAGDIQNYMSPRMGLINISVLAQNIRRALDSMR